MLQEEKNTVKLFISKFLKNAYLMTAVSYIAPARYYFIVSSFYSLRFMSKVRLGFMYRYVSAVLAIGYI